MQMFKKNMQIHINPSLLMSKLMNIKIEYLIQNELIKQCTGFSIFRYFFLTLKEKFEKRVKIKYQLHTIY